MTERGPRSAPVLIALALCATLLFAGFAALGIWQIERRAWKLDLIERVDQRVHATPAAAPGPEQWPKVNAAADEYRRVSVTGTLLHDRETLVQATTALGSGYWVLTPLRTSDGNLLLINRGYVPLERRDRAARSADEPIEVTVTGLMRLTEPGGSFMRHNDPAANRWYSRDVQAIATARGLDRVAPYFVDAEAAPARPGAASASGRTQPVGGLTVIAFQNNHLTYAITWFALALMIAGAAWHVGRDELRLRGRRIGKTSEDPGDD